MRNKLSQVISYSEYSTATRKKVEQFIKYMEHWKTIENGESSSRLHEPYRAIRKRWPNSSGTGNIFPLSGIR
jgi:hypothetical protein